MLWRWAGSRRSHLGGTDTAKWFCVWNLLLTRLYGCAACQHNRCQVLSGLQDSWAEGSGGCIQLNAATPGCHSTSLQAATTGPHAMSCFLYLILHFSERKFSSYSIVSIDTTLAVTCTCNHALKLCGRPLLLRMLRSYISSWPVAGDSSCMYQRPWQLQLYHLFNICMFNHGVHTAVPCCSNCNVLHNFNCASICVQFNMLYALIRQIYHAMITAWNSYMRPQGCPEAHQERHTMHIAQCLTRLWNVLDLSRLAESDVES